MEKFLNDLLINHALIKYDFDYYYRIIPEEWIKEKGRKKYPKLIKFRGNKIKRR